jgi:hypothetical protein
MAPVLPDVIGQHLEELAFLSIQRRTLLFADDVSLAALQRHEERLAAHWDGLRTGGAASVRLALERIDAFDPWERYAAARVWLELGSPTGAEVIARIARTEPELLGVWSEALRRVPLARLELLLPVDAASQYGPSVLSVVVDAWGWHGALDERMAVEAGAGVEPIVRGAVARTFGWIPAVAQSRALVPALARDSSPLVSRRALWSIALCHPAAALGHCRRRAAAGDADAFVLRVLALLGGPEDEELLAPLAGTPDERWLLAPAREGQESMALIWRSVVRHARPELDWLRREVPDGFFDDGTREDAVPGE